MESDVLIDSNVFIALLKQRMDPATVLLDWCGRGNLVTCGMVRVEVLRGLSLPKAYQRVSAFMDVMLNVPSDEQVWKTATELAWKLDRRGWVVPAADHIIAASALKIGAAIMTSDLHFSKIEGLQVITPPAEWFV